MRTQIFIDLDGTILDARERLYRLFQHLVPASKLSFDEYWDLKRNKISHKEILGNRFSYCEEDIKDFNSNWMSRIELPEWLDYDMPFEGVVEYLSGLAENCSLYVVTARQSKGPVENQLSRHGLNDIFEDVLVTCQTQQKCDLITDRVSVSPQDWLIGDTGTDILTGKKLGLKTAAVLSGFMNAEFLSDYRPDVIVQKLTDFKIQA